MKIKFILDRANHWLACLEASDSEMEPLFPGEDLTLKLPGDISLQKREKREGQNLIGIFNSYNEIINSEDLAKTINYL